MNESIITLDERSRLFQLEETIRQGLNTFVDVGNALLEIRDKRLYRQEYSTFEDYCREQWNMKQSRAYQFMDSAKVIGNLQSSTIVELLPTNESQARPLTSLEPAEQVEAWKRVITSTPEGKITAAVEAKAADIEPSKKVAPVKLTENEFSSLENYANMDYRELNAYLRGVDPSRPAPQIKDRAINETKNNLDAAMKKSVIDDDMVVYRGVTKEFYDNLDGIEEFRDHAFISTSSNKSIAADFGANRETGESWIVKINVPKGAHGIDIEKFLQTGESEWLLDRGYSFKVTSLRSNESLTSPNSMRTVNAFIREIILIRR